MRKVLIVFAVLLLLPACSKTSATQDANTCYDEATGEYYACDGSEANPYAGYGYQSVIDTPAGAEPLVYGDTNLLGSLQPPGAGVEAQSICDVGFGNPYALNSFSLVEVYMWYPNTGQLTLFAYLTPGSQSSNYGVQTFDYYTLVPSLCGQQ